jgi:hypothetical protein
MGRPPNLKYPPTWALGIFCPWCNPIIFKRGSIYATPC